MSNSNASFLGEGALFRDDEGLLWFYSENDLHLKLLDDPEPEGGYPCNSVEEAKERLVQGGWVTQYDNIEYPKNPNYWYLLHPGLEDFRLYLHTLNLIEKLQEEIVVRSQGLGTKYTLEDLEDAARAKAHQIERASVLLEELMERGETTG